LTLDEICTADSPRLRGIDPHHVAMLLEQYDVLPPIVVHAETGKVIDGLHRGQEARERGEAEMDVLVFRGSESAAFVLSVEANISHGMPLSVADRRAAAARILHAYPTWSDRRVATVCGLSASTVARLRGRVQTSTESSQLRVGLDGKLRPTNSAARRFRASEIIKERPEATLRQIAAEAGISLGTAHDVRERLRHGEPPVPARQLKALADGDYEETTSAGAEPAVVRDDRSTRKLLLESLCRDPSVRFTDSDRRLVRWLTWRTVGVEGWDEAIDGLQPHCGFVLGKLARSLSDEWAALADLLEDRARP
jgi:uncharacterized protein YerC